MPGRKRVGFNVSEGVEGEDDDESENEKRRESVINQARSMTASESALRRLHQKRVSLLGKPIHHHAYRRSMKYRFWQNRIYNFLERPRGWKAVIYHVLVFLTVFVCLILSVLATIPEYATLVSSILVHTEIVVLIWLALEFTARIWSAGCRSRYQKWIGRVKFLRKPFCILDLTVILASIITIALGTSGNVFAASALRGLRFFQILRMLRMDRRGGTWKLLGSVVWAHRQELITTMYIGFLSLIFTSFVVYLIEKDDNPEKFGTYADALWWGVITLCTVGYGDVVPITWGGKLVGAFAALAGISFFALPAGILGSGFALKVQQQQRQKHLNRRRGPAANLIQCLWRCYAADSHSLSIATWKIHMKPVMLPDAEPHPIFSAAKPFASRFSMRRKPDRPPSSTNHTSSFKSPGSIRRLITGGGSGGGSSSVESTSANSQLLPAEERAETSFSFKRNSDGKSSNGRSRSGPQASPSSEDFEEFVSKGGWTVLTEQHKNAIRIVRKIKYFISRRKFREALRPYDVKDVIEQYSSGHIDLLTRTKWLQSRLDVILGDEKNKDRYESKTCLASRVVKVERQVEDIEAKLDRLIDMYEADRKLLPGGGGVVVGGSGGGRRGTRRTPLTRHLSDRGVPFSTYDPILEDSDDIQTSPPLPPLFDSESELDECQSPFLPPSENSDPPELARERIGSVDFQSSLSSLPYIDEEDSPSRRFHTTIALVQHLDTPRPLSEPPTTMPPPPPPPSTTTTATCPTAASVAIDIDQPSGL